MAGKQEQPNNIAIVLCDCGGTLAEAIDFTGLTKRLGEMEGTAAVRVCSGLCQGKGCAETVGKVAGGAEQRLVVGACSREVFEEPLRKAMAKRKINDGLVWSVNIREQCGWVHKNKVSATYKAFELISGAVRRVVAAEPIATVKVAMCPDVVVAGAGVAGLQAAVALAERGHQVSLVTAGERLGGTAAQMPQLYGHVADSNHKAAAAVSNVVAELVEQASNSTLITVYRNSTIKAVQGQLGDYAVRVSSPEGEIMIGAGAVVLAVGVQGKGGATGNGSTAGQGQVDMVGLTRLMISRRVPKRVAILMDVAGEQGRSVSAAVLSAAELLAGRHRAVVKVFCKNIRVAAAGMEQLYRRARQAGATIVKLEESPTISQRNRESIVSWADTTAQTEMTEDFDLIVCADAKLGQGQGNGVAVSEAVEGLRTGPGGLQGNNVWLDPVGTNREGIFTIGGARGNGGDGELREGLAEGLAVSHQVGELLTDAAITVDDDAAVVDADKCVACLTCMRLCPHGAVSFDAKENAASISTVGCKRCGVCAAGCPALAIQLKRYSDAQMVAEIGEQPRYTVFVCENSADKAATAAGVRGIEYDPQVRLIRVPCAGKVDARAILAALENGAEKVAVIGCHPESCQSLSGASHAVRKVASIQEMLSKVGLDESRVFFGGIAALESGKFIDYVTAE